MFVIGYTGSIHLIYLMSISRAVCLGLLTVIGAGSIESLALAAPTPKELQLAQATSTNSVNLANAFNGSNTILLGSLTNEWRAMGISNSGEMGLAGLYMYSGLFPTMSYYTKGQSIAIGSDNFLVAYSLSNTTNKISVDTPLSLSLINLKNIGAFNDIRSFDIAKETKVLEKQLTFINRTSGIYKSSTTTAPRAEPNPTEEVPRAESKPTVRKPIKKGSR
jgi:hypothetical protein